MSTPPIPSLPRFAGGYRIGPASGGVVFEVAEKPAWPRRLFVRLLLGWAWVDSHR